MTIRKLALVAIPVLLAAVGTSSIQVVAQVPGPAGAGSVVATKDGPVRGVVSNGVNAYLGIPYASPPARSIDSVWGCFGRSPAETVPLRPARSGSPLYLSRLPIGRRA